MNDFDRIEIALRAGAITGVDFVLALIQYRMPDSKLISICEAYKAKCVAEVKEYQNEKTDAEKQPSVPAHD